MPELRHRLARLEQIEQSAVRAAILAAKLDRTGEDYSALVVAIVAFALEEEAVRNLQSGLSRTARGNPKESIMAARTERDTLNGLIEMCRDAARGFQMAADHVGDPELKRLFEEAASQRDLFAAELLPFAQRLGGGADAGGTTLGKLHRGWMLVREAMSPFDERMVLGEALCGEAAAVDAYSDAISSLLPPNARPVVEHQYEGIRLVQRELSEFALPCA